MVLAPSVVESRGAEKVNTTTAVRCTPFAPFAGVTSERLKGGVATLPPPPPPPPPHAATQRSIIIARNLYTGDSLSLSRTTPISKSEITFGMRQPEAAQASASLARSSGVLFHIGNASC